MSLQQNTRLIKFYLNNNEISDDGAKTIGIMLQTNNSLEEIGLVGNQISDDGIKAIISGLTLNYTLRSLNLLDNIFSKENAIELFISTLSKNLTLIAYIFTYNKSSSLMKFYVTKLLLRKIVLPKKLIWLGG